MMHIATIWYHREVIRVCINCPVQLNVSSNFVNYTVNVPTYESLI